jgi:hypothetical protein
MDVSASLRGLWDDLAQLEEQIRGARRGATAVSIPTTETSSATLSLRDGKSPRDCPPPQLVIVNGDMTETNECCKSMELPVSTDEELGQERVQAQIPSRSMFGPSSSAAALRRAVSTPATTTATSWSSSLSWTSRRLLNKSSREYTQRTTDPSSLDRVAVRMVDAVGHCDNVCDDHIVMDQVAAVPHLRAAKIASTTNHDDDAIVKSIRVQDQIDTARRSNSPSPTNVVRLDTWMAQEQSPHCAPQSPMDACKSAQLSPNPPPSPLHSPSSLPRRQHCRWWGHGRLWTSVALAVAALGCALAVTARQSTHFVLLEQWYYIAPIYQPVQTMGLIRMQLCLNETSYSASATAANALDASWSGSGSAIPTKDPVITSGNDEMDRSGCAIVRLSPDDVDDPMFNFARSLLTLGTALGLVLTILLSLSMVWESINLRPIGFGYLLAYFFQSFAMLCFDSHLCNIHQCRMGPGGIACILASVCWIGACIAVAKMDSSKIKLQRARRKATARQAKREQRRAKLERSHRCSDVVVMTEGEDGSSIATAGASDMQGSVHDAIVVVLRVDDGEEPKTGV